MKSAILNIMSLCIALALVNSSSINILHHSEKNIADIALCTLSFLGARYALLLAIKIYSGLQSNGR
ncbi:hypothetical protein [Photorhabdus asymbiotica]|uniref:Uncharacterized protein n=1 Tax=Photorhabdus asymbiotica TaxID=291112 RepID=A0ABX9STA1_9GAMM|nr:hypothetical protein [Photorhabdus asymbiotica]RKS66618.1 hypothetical protein BDD30_0946 [Photorhabdus asymbiotica]